MNKRRCMKRTISLFLVGIMCFGTFFLSISFSYADETGGTVLELAVSCEPQGAGIITADRWHTPDTSTTISVVVNEGYQFIGWRDSQNNIVSTSESYTFKIVKDTSFTAVFEMKENPEFAGGNGTVNNPYRIESAEQLFRINQYLDKHFKQVSSINLRDYEEDMMIGNGAHPFTGSFDGNGKTISYLTIHRPDTFNSTLPESYHVGLFYVGEEGVLEDITIKDASIKATGTAGILAGVNCGEIRNCHVEGNVSVTHNQQGAGGLVGENSNLISHCSAKGYVNGKTEIGGLVGKNTVKETIGRINHCFAEVEVQATNCGGGLVGFNESGFYNSSEEKKAMIEQSYTKGTVNGEWSLGGLVGNNNGTIDNCYSTVTVNGIDAGDIYGGFVGNNGGTITNSYSIGSVADSTEAGGFCGSNTISNGIQNCFYDKNLAGKSDEGKGIPKTTAELMQQGIYIGWDFDTVWTKQSTTYPYFSWQSSNYPIADDVIATPTLTVQSTASNSVGLTWNVIADATEYKVYKGNSSGNYELVGSTENTSYTVNELQENTMYYFAVIASNGIKESVYSNEVTALPKEVLIYDLNVVVKDVENTPIVGVKIIINSQEKITDEEGCAIFSLANGSYTYSTTKNGYANAL